MTSLVQLLSPQLTSQTASLCFTPLPRLLSQVPFLDSSPDPGCFPQVGRVHCPHFRPPPACTRSLAQSFLANLNKGHPPHTATQPGPCQPDTPVVGFIPLFMGLFLVHKFLEPLETPVNRQVAHCRNPTGRQQAGRKTALLKLSL